MAAKKASFVDEHIEKVVIGVCGLALLGAIYVTFMSGRFVTEDGSDAGALVARVGEQANNAADNVLRASPPAQTAAAPAGASADVETLKHWFGETADGLIAIAQIKSPAGRTQPFPPVFYSTTEVAPEDRHNLATLERPGLPVATSGRSVFELPLAPPPLADFDGTAPKTTRSPSTRNWVAVGAQVDLVQQDINFKTVKYPEGSYLAIVQVHLERFDENEAWRGWQPVEAYTTYAPISRPSIIDPRTGVFKLEGLTDFQALLDEKQELIARAVLPVRTGGDKIAYPPLPYFPEPPGKETSDATARAKKWLGLAQKAKDGKAPFTAEDPDAALILLRAVIGSAGVSDREVTRAKTLMNQVVRQIKKSRKGFKLDETVRPPERLMPIVAYDLSPVPGHTYTYRIRYEAFNNFAGNQGELSNPADAERLTVFSEWSPPTRPITIESDTYFYLTRADEKKNEVTVTVYKKKGRESAKEATFKVQVGEEIGGEKRKGTTRSDFSTGAVCLDIDFNRKINGKSEVTLVYVDTLSGTVREKYLSADQKDQFRKSLESEKTAARD